MSQDPSQPVAPLSHESFMRLAIQNAMMQRRHPFGAVIVDSGTRRVVAQGHNRVGENPTWHGEIDAINDWARTKPDVAPENLILYTTAEPCPMCQSAILWMGIGTVVYGTSIETLMQLGWNQITIKATDVCDQTPFRNCTVIPGVLRSQCDALFKSARGL